MKSAILGVGSTLVDLLARVDDSFLQTIDGEKGGMVMVDPLWQEQTIAHLPQPPVRAPGGAAGNTLFALARLGNPCAMLGKIGNDEAGNFYRDALRACGASDACLVISDRIPTGRCLALVTPDSQRTMRTDLGASATLSADEAAAADFSPYQLVYVEGYILFLGEVFETVLRRARESGCKVAVDLASFEVVRLFRDRIEHALRHYVDLVFANEDEAAALWPGAPEDELLRNLADCCPVAALKLGARGARVAAGTESVTVTARPVTAVDTTAAGDLWAAGFLHAYLAGKPLAACAGFAAAVAAEVVQVMGSVIPPAGWTRLEQEFQKLEP